MHVNDKPSAREQFPNKCSCGVNYHAENMEYLQHLKKYHLKPIED